MRRRRQKNPLLGRILLISVVVHIIALPILAHFGAFKKIQREFLQTQMVVLPPPKVEQQKAEVKPKAAKKAVAAKAKGSATAHQRVASAKANPFQPKVVAAAPGGGADGGDDGATVTQGNGKAGELPVQPNTGGTTKTEPANAAPVPEKKPETPPVEPPKVAQEPPKPEVKPVPLPQPEVKKEPVIVDAVAVSTPQPTIPDDLRSEAIDKTCVAEFVVSPDGSPSDVRISQSSGNDELDRLALDTARQWRFKPATRDGQPIESRVRLHIEFQVS